jgi:hypothetical protein
VYIDLLRSDGRAEEMAEHLRHERIGFRAQAHHPRRLP